MKIKFDFNKIIGYFNLGSERGLSIKPLRDWKVVLTCSALFLVLVFGVDIYSLLSVKNKIDLVAVGTKNNKEVKIDEVAMDNVLREIETKAENFIKDQPVSLINVPVATTTSVR